MASYNGLNNEHLSDEQYCTPQGEYRLVSPVCISSKNKFKITRGVIRMEVRDSQGSYNKDQQLHSSGRQRENWGNELLVWVEGRGTYDISGGACKYLTGRV